MLFEKYRAVCTIISSIKCQTNDKNLPLNPQKPRLSLSLFGSLKPRLNVSLKKKLGSPTQEIMFEKAMLMV